MPANSSESANQPASSIRVLMPDGQVSTMQMEAYLAGAIAVEMGIQAPLEALKAQAVASRTYAASIHRHAEQGADVCTTAHCQEWKRIDPIVAPEVFRAVSETWGMVAVYKGSLIQAFFFEHCDGHTRSPEDILLPPVPYLQRVECECGFKSLKGHGVGLCQRGAVVMARRGATFEQIIRRYYSGAEIVHAPRGAADLAGAVHEWTAPAAALLAPAAKVEPRPASLSASVPKQARPVSAPPAPTAKVEPRPAPLSAPVQKQMEPVQRPFSPPPSLVARIERKPMPSIAPVTKQAQEGELAVSAPVTPAAKAEPAPATLAVTATNQAQPAEPPISTPPAPVAKAEPKPLPLPEPTTIQPGVAEQAVSASPPTMPPVQKATRFESSETAAASSPLPVTVPQPPLTPSVPKSDSAPAALDSPAPLPARPVVTPADKVTRSAPVAGATPPPPQASAPSTIPVPTSPLGAPPPLLPALPPAPWEEVRVRTSKVHIDHLPGERMIAGCLDCSGRAVHIRDEQGRELQVTRGSAAHYGEGGFEASVESDGRYFVTIGDREMEIQVHGDTVFIHCDT